MSLTELPLLNSFTSKVMSTFDNSAFLLVGSLESNLIMSALCEKGYLESKDLLIIRPKIMMYGKEISQHRDVGFFSNESEGYRYSGKLAASIPLTPSLKMLLKAVNQICGSEFNGILVNRYNEGDYISAHSDDEKALDTTGVLSITMFPETNPLCRSKVSRIFRIRSKASVGGIKMEDGKMYGKNEIVKDIPLKHMDICLMGGEYFQRNFTHEIPKSTLAKDIRVSFTFRKHIK
jgi:alkylated DNA repair dioxygenase AlkB